MPAGFSPLEIFGPHVMTRPDDVERQGETTGRIAHLRAPLPSRGIGAHAWHFVSIVGDSDILRLHVEIEGVVPAVSPDTRMFDPAEWRRQVAHVVGIHPDHTRVQIASDAMSTAHVARPDIPGEPITNVVS